MKALKIALFACIFSVFFSFTAFADTITTQNIQPGETVTAHLTTWIAYNNPKVDHVVYGTINLRLNNYGAFKLLGASVTSVSSNGPAFHGSGAITTQSGTSASGVLSGSWNVNYNGQTYIYVNVEATVQNISSYADSAIFVLSSNFGNYGNNGPSNLTINNNINSAQNKLDAILNALDSSSVVVPDFLGPDAIFYFTGKYFDSIWTTKTEYPDSNGYFQIASTANQIVFFNNNTVDYAFSPGRYYVVLSFYADEQPTQFNIFGQQINDFVIQKDWQIANLYRLYAVFDVDRSFGRELAVRIDSNFISGLFFGGVAKYPTDSIAGDAYNPEQESKNNELNSEATNQSQQEKQLWQNVNTYKSQLDFGLDSWSDAADGLDYVTDVFLLIWNNSPTQIITLSLMLGIGMLAIGRGVMAARRQAKDDT